MSKKLFDSLISKMHLRLSKIIEENKYDLLNSEVLKYSRRLDRVLCYYSKYLEKKFRILNTNPPDKTG